MGGLRGGWAEYANDALSFHDYSYVPGMILSGTIRLETGSLQIGGASAAHGTLRRNLHGQYVGRARRPQDPLRPQHRECSYCRG